GTTGAFLGAFVPSGSGGLDHPRGLVIGPDGNLYVVSGTLTGGDAVLRVQGPTGPAPGAFLGTVVAAGRGGLISADTALLFGPDGEKDGKLDLYVGSSQFKTFPTAVPGTSEVLRYDGTTGAFVDVFVSPDSGGLQCSTFGLTFTETNPTTLNYDGLKSAVSPRQSARPAASGTLTTSDSNSGVGTPAHSTGAPRFKRSTQAPTAFDPVVVVALPALTPAVIAGPGSPQVGPTLLSQPGLPSPPAGFTASSPGPAGPTGAAFLGASVEGRSSRVLDQVFADLDGGFLANSLGD